MKKEDWPDFPFPHWTETQATLQNIASHLHEKLEGYRGAFMSRGGAPTPIEQQIIEHLIGLQQQVFVLEDVLQASLQVIDDQRASQRVNRASRWIGEKVRKYWRKLYKILAIVGALATLWQFKTLLVRLLARLFK